MNPWQKWKARWFRWEFWSFWFFYIPVYFYFIWLALRERSFFFFATANPTMDFGGMVGEKKSDIFKWIPQEYYPKTILIKEGDRSNLTEIAANIGFPLIAKPDIGERGKGVEVMHSGEELANYSSRANYDFLLQEMVTYPLELGVFYVRFPSETSGRITSIVSKEFLSVTGDGQSTVKELMMDKERAVLQVDWVHERLANVLEQVPDRGEKLVVEPIGNHCRGTKFLNATQEADDKMNAAIDFLAKRIEGFYYGRFDLKCQSFDDLRELKNFKIVELNGVGAEPAHIYQPGFSLFEAYAIVMDHYKWMARVARENKERGIPYWSFRRGLKKLSDIRAYNRRINHT
ncbi:MAG: hypothetical protein RIF46_10610 [Cyclobacteriaceae bacterium]